MDLILSGSDYGPALSRSKMNVIDPSGSELLIHGLRKKFSSRQSAIEYDGELDTLPSNEMVDPKKIPEKLLKEPSR